MKPDALSKLGPVIGDRLLCELEDELFAIDVRAVHHDGCIDVVGFSPLTGGEPDRVHLRRDARGAVGWAPSRVGVPPR
jgi:hypothetical protein